MPVGRGADVSAASFETLQSYISQENSGQVRSVSQMWTNAQTTLDGVETKLRSAFGQVYPGSWSGPAAGAFNDQQIKAQTSISSVPASRLATIVETIATTIDEVKPRMQTLQSEWDTRMAAAANPTVVISEGDAVSPTTYTFIADGQAATTFSPIGAGQVDQAKADFTASVQAKVREELTQRARTVMADLENAYNTAKGQIPVGMIPAFTGPINADLSGLTVADPQGTAAGGNGNGGNTLPAGAINPGGATADGGGGDGNGGNQLPAGAINPDGADGGGNGADTGDGGADQGGDTGAGGLPAGAIDPGGATADGGATGGGATGGDGAGAGSGDGAAGAGGDGGTTGNPLPAGAINPGGAAAGGGAGAGGAGAGSGAGGGAGAGGGGAGAGAADAGGDGAGSGSGLPPGAINPGGAGGDGSGAAGGGGASDGGAGTGAGTGTGGGGGGGGLPGGAIIPGGLGLVTGGAGIGSIPLPGPTDSGIPNGAARRLPPGAINPGGSHAALGGRSGSALPPGAIDDDPGPPTPVRPGFGQPATGLPPDGIRTGSTGSFAPGAPGLGAPGLGSPGLGSPGLGSPGLGAPGNGSTLPPPPQGAPADRRLGANRGKPGPAAEEAEPSGMPPPLRGRRGGRKPEQGGKEQVVRRRRQRRDEPADLRRAQLAGRTDDTPVAIAKVPDLPGAGPLIPAGSPDPTPPSVGGRRGHPTPHTPQYATPSVVPDRMHWAGELGGLDQLVVQPAAGTDLGGRRRDGQDGVVLPPPGGPADLSGRTAGPIGFPATAAQRRRRPSPVADPEDPREQEVWQPEKAAAPVLDTPVAAAAEQTPTPAIGRREVAEAG
jgi:hypothetical protein